METLLNRNLTDQAAFEEHLARYETLPWLQDYKNKQWKRFNELDLPTRKTETFRFSSIKRITLDGYTGCESSPASALDFEAKSKLISNPAASIGIVDNTTAFFDDLPTELADKGVIFLPLDKALHECGDLVKDHLPDSFTRLGSDKILALHAAYISNGMFLYVPKNVEIKDPFIAYHWGATANGAIFPHSLVVAEDNSAVSCIDVLASADSNTHVLSCSASSLKAAPGAKVNRKFIQNFSEESLSFHVENLTADRDAQPTSIVINLGGHYARLENQLDIDGKGADVRVYGLTVAAGKQEFDQRTLQIHKQPNTNSDLLYKNALLEKSRTIFSGLIKVEEGAQQTDAYQTNRNLQLSSDSEANSLPGLEILANDVKCSHGATTSRLDESELFYMRARGISPDEAKRLLVFGFFEEVIEKIDHEELADAVRTLVHEKFDRIRQKEK